MAGFESIWTSPYITGVAHGAIRLLEDEPPELGSLSSLRHAQASWQRILQKPRTGATEKGDRPSSISLPFATAVRHVREER